MKRKWICFIFCATISSMFLFVLFVVPDKMFLFKNAFGDCSGRAMFMYFNLYEKNAEADVVLFGSSRTMNGVNDSVIGKNKLLNLGYCRFGRNLDHFFIEEYLKEHRPSNIILEIREDEGENSHPLTPFLLPVSKIADGFYTLDADVFSNIYNKWLCNLKYIRNKVFSVPDVIPFANNNQKGFWENLTITDIKQLETKKTEDSLEIITEKNDSEFLNKNSTFYFKKIKQVCDQKKIELYFLYLPSYGNVYKTPRLQKEYFKYGKCIIPPDSIFCCEANFADYNHLNRKGATIFSIWLNNYLDNN